MTGQRAEELTDEQWAVLEPLLPELPRREDGRGRPWRDNREVMNGVLWVLRSGARWKDLPARFPPYKTCHRRFQRLPKLGEVGCGLRRAEVVALEAGDYNAETVSCWCGGARETRRAPST